MNIGLYFGSFNPIHIGHLIIANHVLENTELDKIWFVVSPHNPLKDSKSLLNEYDRFHLVEMAIEDNKHFRASNIEFSMPRPSYTIDTLTYMREKFPIENFALIMGSDSYKNLPRWKNSEELLRNYPIFLYNRPNSELDVAKLHPNTKLLQAPLLEVSATHIRSQIKSGKSIQYLVPDTIRQYILDNNYYL